MNRVTIDSQTLTRRALFLGAGGVAVFGGLASRLYYLQVLRAQDYRVLSEKNRFNFNILIPSRGRILDRHGEALAVNKQNYRVVLVAEQVKDINATLDKLSETIVLRPATRRRILSDIKNHASFVPVLVDDHLGWNKFAALNLNALDLPGVIPQVGEGRYYPNKGVFAHVLGYVGRAGPDDVKTDTDPLLRQPTFRIGKTGIEASSDKVLRGASGRLKVEVSAIGRIVREWPNPKERAVTGEDVYLTLDANLQRRAAELFEEDSGGAVVMDVITGEVRTFISMPTFDGNLFVSGLTREDMDGMNSDVKRPQFNKVVGGGYPPASTFKMVVMLAALKENIVDPNDTVFCSGKVFVGNRDFHCWKRRGHRRINMHDALKLSCDVYFYELVQRLGMPKIREMALKLGLGQVYSLGLGGQTPGIIPDDEWKRKQLGEGWRTGDSLNAGIGQGFVLVNPLQLAVMTARIANGGRAVNPFLVIGDAMPPVEDLDIDPVHLSIVRNAMLSVCEEPGGTGFNGVGLGIKGVQMAGKTGTGQVRTISTAERLSGVIKNRDLEWRYRDHSIFVAYAPFDNPRFAASTIVEHGGEGSGRAATIVRRLLEQALRQDGIGPRTDIFNSTTADL